MNGSGCVTSVRAFKVGEVVVQIVDVKGYLDAHTFAGFETTLRGLITKGGYNLILNLKELQYMSSAGIAVLMSVIKEVRKNSGDMKLVNVPEKIFTIIKVIGFAKLLQIFDNEKDALLSFNK